MRLISLIFLILICGSAKAEQIKPFTSDGCSAFPDGTIKQNDLWLSCCTKHDKAYWQGGTYTERANADRELKTCVEKVAEPVIATLILAGVRVGGSPFWPTKFRWGYGWSYLRGYKKITEAEFKVIKKVLGNSK